MIITDCHKPHIILLFDD